MLNRGRSYWDGRAKHIFSKFSNVFKFSKVDRETKEYTSRIEQIFKETSQPIDAIIDFCAYDVADA